MKKIFPTILLVLLVVTSSWYTLTRVDTSNWKTYTNTSYGYQVKYPANMEVGYPGGNGSVPVERSDIAIIDVPNRGGIEFQVTAYVPQTDYNSDAITERNGLIALSLQKFAEAVRQVQVNDKNPYTLDKKTGGLKEVTFAGQKGYSFTLTKSFNQGLGGGYSLQPDDAVFDFIFIENKAGQKIMISYLLSSTVAEHIKDSFQLTDSVK